MSEFILPKLKFELDALKPHLSKETLEYHYGKHHKTYVDNLNGLVQNKPEANKSLEQLVKESTGPLFNNAAQHWNHSFYWNCLAPKGGGEPKGKLQELFKKNFGSFADLKTKFTDASVKLFGSGWAWIVKKSDGSLEIVQTTNAENPMKNNATPILTCDVWEHAYYIDYRNARAKYVEAFWNIINWEYVESCLNKPIDKLL